MMAGAGFLIVGLFTCAVVFGDPPNSSPLTGTVTIPAIPATPAPWTVVVQKPEELLRVTPSGKIFIRGKETRDAREIGLFLYGIHDELCPQTTGRVWLNQSSPFYTDTKADAR
jgi:hypothetical protein